VPERSGAILVCSQVQSAGSKRLLAAESGAAIESTGRCPRRARSALGGQYYVAMEILGGMLASFHIEQAP
jgi:hypothetical protein